MISCDCVSCSCGLSSLQSVTEADETRRLYPRKEKSPRGVRDTSSPSLCGLETCSSAGYDHSSSTSPLPQNVNIHFLHPAQLQHESTNVQRDGEGSQEPRSSNLFHVIFPLLSRSLESSSSVSTSHHQHPSLLLHSPFISFPPVPTHCCKRRCMIYEALFLPVTEEKERREPATKRGERQRGRRMEGRV